MTSYKNTRKRMYSVPMDVRALNKVFNRVTTDVATGVDRQEIPDAEIETYIYDADAIINAYLNSYYGTDALANETPYYRGPVSLESNKGLVKLGGVTIAITAITEQWIIEFGDFDSSDRDTFTLTGSFSMGQGSGNTETAFSATDADISIAIADWVYANDDDRGHPGDQIIFASYISHPLIRHLSSLLAAAALSDVLYSEAESGQSGWGKTYYKKAMDILKDLIDPKSKLSLEGAIDEAPAFETWGYQIDEYGRDRSSYMSITNDALPYGD